MRRPVLTAIATAVVLAGAAVGLGSAHAQAPLPFSSSPGMRGAPPRSHQDDARNALRSGQVKPFGEIQAAVQSQLGAKVVGVDLREEPGRRFIYHVKAIDRYGQLLAVAVDAQSARILSVRGGGR
jgi:hypothetical protein